MLNDETEKKNISLKNKKKNKQDQVNLLNLD
jgi:hypothetical protein